MAKLTSTITRYGVNDTITLPYKTPGDRALGTFFKQLLIDCFIAFGGLGGAEILDQIAGTDHINWQTVIIAVVTLVLKTGATTAMKYQNAKGQELEPEDE